MTEEVVALRPVLPVGDATPEVMIPDEDAGVETAVETWLDEDTGVEAAVETWLDTGVDPDDLEADEEGTVILEDGAAVADAVVAGAELLGATETTDDEAELAGVDAADDEAESEEQAAAAAAGTVRATVRPHLSITQVVAAV